MTDAITITQHQHPETGRGEYRAQVAGSDHVGRLQWVEREDPWGNRVRVADHTLVAPEIGGRGVAARLVEAMVADARASGFKIGPMCSYVAAKFEEHPEWSDVRA